MSSRPSLPGSRQVSIALCLFAVAFAVAIVCAATAHAAYYKTLYCAAANGSGDPTLGARPGFFDFTNDCGTAYGDPAGTGGFLRLEENTTGTAGNTDEASYSWWAPPGTSIAAVSAYTREPGTFNEGWRARLWGEGFDGSQNNVLMQGSGVPSEGLFAPSNGNFSFHGWPFGGYADYKRIAFTLTCYRPAGCSREGWNAADVNSVAITLNDKEDPHVNWEGDSRVLAGEWVRGETPISWRESDLGSGLRFSRLRIDGATLPDGTIDYQENGGCRTGRSDANGEFARDFQPCTPGPYLRYYGLRTAELSDGSHQLSVCVQDYSQYLHTGGQASESCDTRTIHTDNTAPGKPAELRVTSANPARYLDRFGAAFSLPQDQGSPIVKVHYDIVDASGKVVVPEKTFSAVNPTSLPTIEGPQTPGAYSLRVWLEDEVGLLGAAAIAPIPHDTTPPAAPQEISVAAPSAPRSADGFDVRWHDLTDAGSPIASAHYEIRNGAGAAVVGATEVAGEGANAIADLDTPAERGTYTLLLWLTDAEGNVGAPASVPLSYDCVRSGVQGGATLSAGFEGAPEQILAQGAGTTLEGKLKNEGALGLGGASLCVFATVEGDPGREFLGLASTGQDGSYRFPIAPGPSRRIEILYRPDQRQLSADATLYTRAHPTLAISPRVVRKKHYARFEAKIPGPRAEGVVIDFQVKQGKGWRAFRRCRTGADGRCAVPYRFGDATAPGSYVIRDQDRGQSGYPYLPGNSDPLRLRVRR